MFRLMGNILAEGCVLRVYEMIFKKNYSEVCGDIRGR